MPEVCAQCVLQLLVEFISKHCLVLWCKNCVPLYSGCLLRTVRHHCIKKLAPLYFSSPIDLPMEKFYDNKNAFLFQLGLAAFLGLQHRCLWPS